MAGRLVLESYVFHLIDKSSNTASNHVDARGHWFKRKEPIDSFCIQKDKVVYSSLVLARREKYKLLYFFHSAGSIRFESVD